MKESKRILAVFCTLLMSTALVGCNFGNGKKEQSVENGSSDSKKVGDSQKKGNSQGDVSLELETTWTGDKLEVLNKLLADFTEESGIDIEVISPGDDYENVMKTRMASGDLPDLWETHGWSTTRYSEYLLPLNDEPWTANIKDSIKKTVTNSDGNMFVAPLSIDPASITYNKDLFEEAGVTATDITTWADFESACDKLLKTGKAPIYLGGKSENNIANLFEVIAPGFLTNSDVKENQGEYLLDGKFDWDANWTPIAEMINGWNEKGYFNKDILTASDDSAIQALANGDGAIVVSGNHTITQALTYNPDAKLGIMAIPSPSEGGKVYVSSGEGSCYGMWKETEHPDECKKLLSYLASDKVSVKIATADGKIPAMEGVSNEDEYVTTEFNQMMEAHGDNLLFIDYFDRAFLPSGMWNDMGVSGNEIFMSPGKDGVKKCVEMIENAYKEKINQ